MRFPISPLSPHSIRLRGPWELFLPGSDQPLRIEMPATWQTLLAVAAPLPSPARLVRRFGQPTGLSFHDRLHLVIEGSSADFQVELNGQQVGNVVSAEETCSFEVTVLLNPRNELVIFLPVLLRETAHLESSLFLRDVRLEITAAEE